MLAPQSLETDIQNLNAIDWTTAECRRLVKQRGRRVAEMFYSEQLDDIREAKAVCAACPVAPACLQIAVANREPSGVWGGELFLNGKPLETKRPRGRPPKDPALRKTA